VRTRAWFISVRGGVRGGAMVRNRVVHEHVLTQAVPAMLRAGAPALGLRQQLEKCPQARPSDGGSSSWMTQRRQRPPGACVPGTSRRKVRSIRKWTAGEGCGSSRPAPSLLREEEDCTEDEGEQEGEAEDPEDSSDPDDAGEDEDEGEGQEEPQERFRIYNDTGRPNTCPVCARDVGSGGVCGRCGRRVAPNAIRRAQYGVCRMDRMGLTRGSYGGEIPLR
jgi:hypothetical protein